MRTKDDRLRLRPSHVAICVEFLEQCEPAKRMVKRYTTYNLKHAIERWAGDYILEIECVAALLDCGFFVKSHFYGKTDFTFYTNIDLKTIRRVAAQMRKQ